MFSIYTIKNPLGQFEIRDLIVLDLPLVNNIHISLTNIAGYIIISFIIITILNIMTNKNTTILHKNWNLSKECIHDTVLSILLSQINKTTGQVYFPFIISLFMFILVNNLIGMVPYSFSATSHFVLIFSLSFTIVLGATILGLKEHNIKFFSMKRTYYFAEFEDCSFY